MTGVQTCALPICFPVTIIDVIICVFGAGGNRDALKRPLMGEVASKYSKHIVVTSDNPRFEEPKKITKKDLISSKSQSDENIVLDWEFLEKSLNNKELINKL